MLKLLYINGFKFNHQALNYHNFFFGEIVLMIIDNYGDRSCISNF
ncbi:hypothetical protein [Okeania sp. SIO2B3]|nr:hypothetical protein [Okeania sp. SIO2B3]